jgi:hypothetical protein
MRSPKCYGPIFPKTDIVLQETLQDDTVNIEGGGMDQTLEANEDGF